MGIVVHRWILPFALGAVLSGCALPRDEIAGVDPFPVQAAAETFAVGYDNISQKFIDPVTVSDLAVEGMRGLGAIDPALTIQREGRLVVLSEADFEIAQFEVPLDDDPRAWAVLTTDLSRAGRKISGELRRASIEDIYEAVFDGALSHLDRFSRYAGRKEAQNNRAKRDGFGGIGIRFEIRDGGIGVTEVMEETPAADAGLLTGDLILEVDGIALAGKSSNEVIDLLRGPVETEIVLSTRREGLKEPLKIALERAHVVPTSVRSGYEGGLLTLEVSRFNQATTQTLSRKIKAAFNAHGNRLRGIIIDLRGNPGGLLKQAIRSADLFLTQGELLRTRGRHPDSFQYYEAAGADVAQGLPLVVLIDGKSASAAEILAAALQDRGRAVVVGTTSFGKGSVQTVVRLPNQGEITLTWSRFVTPSGYLLHELGVHPTVCTSGRSKDGPDPINVVLTSRTTEIELLASWRAIADNDTAHRRGLRASCPAERRDDTYDMELARRLLNEPGLYGRLLGLANTTTTAARPDS